MRTSANDLSPAPPGNDGAASPGPICSAARNAYRREVNYVLREAATDEIRCLLVDGPLRIAGFPELVSVQSTGRTLERAGTEWELAFQFPNRNKPAFQARGSDDQ